MKNELKIILITAVGVLMLVLNAQAQGPVRFRVVPPQAVAAGQSVEVVANFSTAPGWYIYAPTGMNEPKGMSETKMFFDLPEGVTVQGELDMPPPKPKGMYEIWEGNKITIKQKLKADANLASGSYSFTTTITYQTCNKDMCLPTYTEDIAMTLTVK